MSHPIIWNDMHDVDEDLIETINRYLLIRTPLRPADLCFVFGTRPGAVEFADETARLWHDGYCQHVLISGGTTPGGDEPEAVMLRRLIVELGVPSAAVLIEDQATNTGENVAFSLPVLEAAIGLERIGSVIAVGKFSTSRRYLMTLERHWPEVQKMLAPIHYHPVDPARWMDHEELRQRVLKEWSKIEPYLARDYLAELRPETCTIV